MRLLLAILFKPRPRGFLGIRLLTFFVVFAILHHLHGRRAGIQRELKQKVAGKSEQHRQPPVQRDAGYLAFDGNVRFET